MRAHEDTVISDKNEVANGLDAVMTLLETICTLVIMSHRGQASGRGGWVEVCRWCLLITQKQMGYE